MSKALAAALPGGTPNSRQTLGEFMKRLAQLLLLGALILLPVKGVQAETPKDPIYVKLPTDGMPRIHTVTSTLHSA